MTRHDMKNPNQNDTTQDKNLSGNQSGASFKDAAKEGKSQGQAYERAGGSQDKSQKTSENQKGSTWTPGDDSDAGTRFDKTQTDSSDSAKRSPGRNQNDE